MRAAVDGVRLHGTMGRDYFAAAAAARAAFARLLGVPAERVAVGQLGRGAVRVHRGLAAGGRRSARPRGRLQLPGQPASPPARDIKVRAVPLEALADAVRPGTALVAFSAVQSADGRIADLAAVREAARAHGARTYIDITQAAGWLPLRAADFDFVVAGGVQVAAVSARSGLHVVRRRTTGGAEDWPAALHAGWVAGEDIGGSSYGPIAAGATARRFDEPHAHFSYTGAEQSLGLLEELGVEAVHAHNTALADRYRAGLAERGLTPRPAPGSAIVSSPGIADAEHRLTDAGVGSRCAAGCSARPSTSTTRPTTWTGCWPCWGKPGGPGNTGRARGR